MGIKISNMLKSAIATENSIEKEAVESTVKVRSGDRCHLCSDAFNYAADDIEVDHDIPQASGGTNQLNNLYLAHVECNRFKKAQGSRDVRNLLKFKRFYNRMGGSLDYTASLNFFGATPLPSIYQEEEGVAKFQFPDGTTPSSPIYSTTHSGVEQKFCFITIPITAIYNDNECQPRLIKLTHVFSIALDLVENPLHEPPACRLKSVADDRVQMLLFDGQHKAIATWLKHGNSIVAKVYLNITVAQARHIVNSIQSKIIKLPLTPFELASKLSDEYRDKLEQYELVVPPDQCSEDGFIASLPPPQRLNAKRDIAAAVLQEIADDPTFLMSGLVEMRGRRVAYPWKISEAAFQNKLLKELAHTDPLPGARYRGSEMQAARVRERQNIIRILNTLYEKVFQLDENSSDQERERARRMSYQSSLKFIAYLIQRIVRQRVVPPTDKLMFVHASPTDPQYTLISADIERMVSHPVWTASFESSPEMHEINDCLQKNQGIDDAMTKAGLTSGYCIDA